MTIETISIDQIKSNPNNPRNISDVQFEKLKKSLREFPEMLELRPLVINQDNIVLGGNMRLKALKDLGYKDISVVRVNDLSSDKEKEFIIKDNVSYGQWDYNLLDLEWDRELLLDWGLEFDLEDDQEDKYTRKIESPTYEPSGEKPKEDSLVNLKKMEELIEKIDKANISEREKEFLTLASYRHIVFDYSKIADFYAHSSKEVQELMEQSALVIIDYNRAIEEGYVHLSKTLAELYSQDHDDQ